MSEQPETESQEATLEQRIEAKLFGKSAPDAEPEAPEQATDSEGQPEGEPTQEVPQASEAEVEFEGKTYKVAPELKDALLRQSDYTKKTQEIAEARKVVSEQERLLQAQGEFQNSILDDLSALKAVDSEIARFGKVDWSQLDTDNLVRTRMALDQLKEQRGAIQAQIQGKAQQFQQKKAEALAKAAASGRALVSQKVPGFDDKAAQELIGYAKAEGFTDAEINAMYDPRVVVLMHKAAQWDKLQASKPDATKRANSAPPVLKPGTSNRGDAKQLVAANYRKAMNQARSEQEKAKLIEARLMMR